MKFQFTTKSSKLFDFLYFPKLLHQKAFLEESSSLSLYKNAIDASYQDVLSSYETILTPFSKDIDFFYKKGFAELEFIDFFTNKLSLLDFEDAESILNYLLTLNDQTLKRAIIDTLNEEKEEGDKGLTFDASNDELIAFLDQLNLDATWKWHIFLVIQSPAQYVEKYVALMQKLLPIFLDLYQPFEEEVRVYGTYLEAYLNTHKGNGIEELSDGMIKSGYLIQEDNLLVVSAIFAYTIMVSSHSQKGRICWGLKIDAAIKKIKEINQDKLNERVQIFKFLGDKTKYEVLRYISKGITSTKELAALTHVSSATISYHINAFMSAKVITLDSSNKKFSYVINYDLLNEILMDFKSDINF